MYKERTRDNDIDVGRANELNFYTSQIFCGVLQFLFPASLNMPQMALDETTTWTNSICGPLKIRFIQMLTGWLGSYQHAFLRALVLQSINYAILVLGEFRTKDEAICATRWFLGDRLSHNHNLSLSNVILHILQYFHGYF